MPGRARVLIATSLAALIAASGVASTALPAQAATRSCAGLTSPVYERVNPTSGAELLTRSLSEANAAAAKYGFTEDHGTPFRAAAAPTRGTDPIHRLYRSDSQDFVWIRAGAGLRTTVSSYGYVDQGTNFHAPRNSGAGCVAVIRLYRGDKHRYAVGSEASSLIAAGWTDEGVAFYAAPGSGSGSGGVSGGQPAQFSIAVLPDTQNWVTHGADDTRLADATSYLASIKDSTNLKEVLQTGDFVNWGWLDPGQFSVASDAFDDLEDAGIPYLLTVGNHDTRAVGVGGSAYVEQNGGRDCVARFGAAACTTQQLVRHTEEFNSVFNASREGAVAGQFEAGKVDNSYNTFTAGGKKWLTLNLEFCPRTEVVDWARSVVAGHADYNVIVETHYYLSDDNSIGNNNQGYGANSPQYVFDNLVSQYPNVKMVFSGHVGTVNYREDTGIHGNKILAMSFNDLGEDRSNTIRLVTINAATGVVSTRLYAHNLNQSYPQYDHSVTLSFQ